MGANAQHGCAPGSCAAGSPVAVVKDNILDSPSAPWGERPVRAAFHRGITGPRCFTHPCAPGPSVGPGLTQSLLPSPCHKDLCLRLLSPRHPCPVLEFDAPPAPSRPVAREQLPSSNSSCRPAAPPKPLTSYRNAGTASQVAQLCSEAAALRGSPPLPQ